LFDFKSNFFLKSTSFFDSLVGLPSNSLFVPGIENDKKIIEKSLHQIEKKGTRAWCGYSFTWMANIYARQKKATALEKCYKYLLLIFAQSIVFI